MKPRVFVLDDETDMILMATSLLEANGYTVESETNSEKGLAKILSTPPDLLLLDVRMPRMDGLDVCKELRSCAKTRRLPIIMVSIQDTEADVVAGLEVGANDYVCKPFRKRELLARVKAALRMKSSAVEPESVNLGPLTLDVASYTARINGNELRLTPKEFQLLAFFVKRNGNVLTRSVISDHVWGVEHNPKMRTIDTHVDSLRKKLGEQGRWIEGLRGIGYRFEIDEA